MASNKPDRPGTWRLSLPQGEIRMVEVVERGDELRVVERDGFNNLCHWSVDCYNNWLGPAETTPAFATHATGAVRSSDADAVRYDLISPIALEAWARTCAEGASKYGDFNWEKGFPIPDILNHAIRHLYLYLAGDRTEEHLAHALWNVGAAIHSEEVWPELNRGKLRREGCLPPIPSETIPTI